MKLDFDAQLTGSNGVTFPVHCEIRPPSVGGQKSMIRVEVPSQHIPAEAPENPCTVAGKCGVFDIKMEGVHWRRFPGNLNNTMALNAIELLHVERLVVKRPSRSDRREIRFHLAPISYLRSQSSFVCFSDSSNSKELFVLDLPGLGQTSFLVEWVTVYHRDAEIPGATVSAGFCAVANLPSDGSKDVDRIVSKFKSSLEVLSVLFRQATTLHGWSCSDGETISTWIAPLEPNMTFSAHEDRGDYVARPQVFIECAAILVKAYEEADKETRSLVRHLSVALNPHVHAKSADRFSFMFSALERVVESAWRKDRTPGEASDTTDELIEHLKRLQKSVAADGGEHALAISARIGGLVKVVSSPSIRDKFDAFFRLYPMMSIYSADLWPVLGTEKERGLREIRNALAHGRGSFVPVNVVAVAGWHLAILLERLVFVLLNIGIPEGIDLNSYLLRHGARGWYERDWWVPLRSSKDRPI